MKKILCVCFSATYQRSIFFENFTIGKVNRSKRYELFASGKAVNSARVLSQLEKGCAITVCPVGRDNCSEFIALSKADGINLNYVETDGKIRECWTLLDGKNGSTTELVVGEPVQDFCANNYDVKILKVISSLLDDADALLLAGSKPSGWPKDLYSAICGIALDMKKLVLADFIGEDLQGCLKSAVPHIIKINDEEFSATFGVPASKENICDMSRRFGNIFVITRGVQSTLAARNGDFFECETLKVDAVNTTACGDSFNAGFLYEFLNSGNMDAALSKGTWCAAQNAKSFVPGSIL